ncbi:MAG: hypothetical protein IJB99_10780, partial [Clostridia bacterium]|nr:hypothetical protein [Clostridia bacterium]
MMEENRAGIFEEENVDTEGYVEEEELMEEEYAEEAYDEEAQQDQYDEGYDELDEEEEYAEEEMIDDEEIDEDEDEGIDYNEFENTVNLIGYLKTELTEHGMNVPLGKAKRVVDVERCLNIIDDLTASLPRAMRHCWRTKDENDRILASAEKHAAARVEKAKEEAQKILDEA